MTSTRHFSAGVAVTTACAFIAAFFFVSAAFAETNTQGGGAGIHQDMRHGTTTTPWHPHATSTAINVACIQSAVDARETAIGTAFDTMQSVVKAALATRKSSLHDAWGLTDRTARRAAIKTAWAKWSTDNKAAQAALKASRKTAWSTFQSAAKACKVSLPPEERLGNDGLGQIAL